MKREVWTRKKLCKTRLRSHCENRSMNRWSNKLQNSRFFFFLKSVKKSVKRGVRVLRAWNARALYARRACEAREKSVSPQSGSLFSASFQTFCLTARGYLNKQKDALFCSLVIKSLRESWIWKKILVGIMNHWSKNDRNHEYQDSNDSASNPRTYSFGKLTWD